MNKAVKTLSIPFALLRVLMIATPVTFTVALSACNTTSSTNEIAAATSTESASVGGAVVSSSSSSGIKLTASQYTLTSSSTSSSYSAGDNYDRADDSSLNVCRLTAESDNDVALTSVTWKAAWASSSVGGSVYDYISITNLSSDGLNVQLTVKKAFGYEIVITAVSADNANATGSVTINYVKRISDFTVSMGTISTVAVSNYSVNVSSLTGTGTLSPKAVTYAYYIKFSSDFSDSSYSYIPISKTMKGTEWYELISGYAKSEEVLENLTDNESNKYVSIYVTATVTYGGETYQFLTSEAYYPSFTDVSKLDVTVSDGSTSQNYSDSDSETVSGEIGEDGSISTEGSYDLTVDTDYTFTADEDGTYTFTSGEDSSVTIGDSSGNEWTIENGESADIELSAGETLDITTNSDSQLTIDSGSGSSSSSGLSTSGNSFTTLENEVTIAVSGAAEDYTVSVSTELLEAVTITKTDDGVILTKNDDYANTPVSGTVTIISGDQSIDIEVSFEIVFAVSTTAVELDGSGANYTDIIVSGGSGTYSVALSSELTDVVTYTWADSTTLRLTGNSSGEASGTITITSGSQSATINVTISNSLIVSSEELEFCVYNGTAAEDPYTKTVTVSGGTGEYSYSLDCDYSAYLTINWLNSNTLQITAYGTSSLSTGTYTGTLTITSGSSSQTIKLVIILDYCLTGDMLITMSDGTQKRVDSLSAGESVLSFNPDTMQLEADEITYSDSAMDKRHTEYDIWTFSDGTIVKTVHRHRLYNVEAQAMVNMDEWHIGEHTYRIDGGIVELVKHENVKEEVNHYTLFTKNQNYFVNGLLSGNKYTRALKLK